jgi:hypothetical protein
MTIKRLSDLAGRTFRAGHAFELVVFDRLPLEEQAVLAELRTDPDLYGVLRPRVGSGRTFRAIGKDAALLMLTLQQPGPLPFFVFSGDVEATVEAVTELVLDGVLEVEDGGRFVSGSAAATLFAGEPEPESTNQGRLSLLSRDALRYGEALEVGDPERLAARLYAFGRRPVTPELARQFRDDEALLTFLGAGSGSVLRLHLDQDWRSAEHSDSRGWLAWSRPGRRNRRATEPVYKLYASPSFADLPRTFETVIERLGRRDDAQFKIGRGAEGLARPDKLVAYFESLDALLEVANDLTSALDGISSDGVPFSAEIALDGALSWGMDPPTTERALTWQAPDSWRLWVVRRLAVAMVAALLDKEPSMPPSQFALERLRREGVDVDRWTPSAAIWSAA